MDIPSACAPILTFFDFSNTEKANSNLFQIQPAPSLYTTKATMPSTTKKLPITDHNIIAQLDGSWPVSKTEAHVVLDTGGLYILFHLVFKHIMLPLAIIFTWPEILRKPLYKHIIPKSNFFLAGSGLQICSKHEANMRYGTMERTTHP